MNTIETVLKEEEKALFALRMLYRQYGYAQYKMSKFEEYELYVRNKHFLVSDHIITFTDTNGKLMALKPDVTLSIVKNSKVPSGSVQKVYYDEKVYRVSKGGDSFREISQVGLECLGDIDLYGIYEVLSLALQSVARISPDYVLDISHLGIVSALLDAMEISETVRRQMLACIGEKNLHGISALCAQAGVTEEACERLKRLISAYGSAEQVLPVLRELFPTGETREVIDGLEEILCALSADFPTERIRLDFSVVNDMRYYNGIVFKGFVNGIPTGVLTGGQYDRLVERMGKKCGAIGFAVYPDLLSELSRTTREYDADVLILYDADTPLATLREQIAQYTDKGEIVAVQKCLPENMRVRRTVRLSKKGVEDLGTDA